MEVHRATYGNISSTIRVASIIADHFFNADDSNDDSNTDSNMDDR